MKEQETESFCPSNQREWRKWLENNHDKKNGVWLIIYKKGSDSPNLSWSHAVDEALCFGWIDSLKRPIDGEKYKQYFGRRKATSTWSKINKDKVEQLIEQGDMRAAGLKSIEIAKENGSWTILDEVEALIIPDDLELELGKHPDAKDYFLSLSKSARKSLLHWIVMAKRKETRHKRIVEIAENAGQKRKPKPFR